MADAAETFLLVDGENIDATLGGSLLGRRPAPEERPRWDRVRDHARAVWDQPVRGLFFLNGSGHVPMAFVQALAALEYRPVLLSGPPDVKVVDVAIAAHARGAGRARAPATSCWPATTATSPSPSRRCCTAAGAASGCSRSASSSAAPSCNSTSEGLEVFDLEDDVGAFTVALPRVRVIPIEQFDPWALLG